MKKIYTFLFAGATMLSPAFAQPIIKVEGGADHTVILKSDGTVWSFGRNTNGQLGDNTTINSSTPIQVHGTGNVGFLTGIIDIGAGLRHSMALRNDGTVWTWGDNADGQIGDGTNTARLTPVQVKGLGNVGFLMNVTKISTSKRVSYALLSDSTVAAWGVDYAGQLGDGGTTARNYPDRVKGYNFVGYLTGIIAIRGNCCSGTALKSDGTVWMWGESQYGQLGRGVVSSTPAQTPDMVHGVGNVGTLNNIIAIGGGSYHIFAINNSGQLFGWGLEATGALGNGVNSGNQSSPVQINLTNVVQVAAGGDPLSPHGMALLSNGQIWSWGYNASGEVGNGNNANQLVPVQSTSITGTVVQIDCGWEHSLIRKSDGSVCTVGENQYGQLGDGTLIDKNVFTCPAVLTSISDYQNPSENNFVYNYPNPSSDFTTIKYHLNSSDGKIVIRDVMGKEIEEFILNTSMGEIRMNKKTSSGIYFIALYQNNVLVSTNKMIMQ
ncbi:MAG: T9SS type A sorting domain-containing protein [Bacteroidetes bacterium]|nr:T9SS type A sorting domain-containing protein [Bacteroidota bacterium]